MIRPKSSPEVLHKVIKKCIWIIGISATLLALQIKSVYELWFLCSDLVYCLLFPQLLCAFYDPKANTLGAISGFTVALILRLGGGDHLLGIPHFINYPLEIEGEILFPFRTFAMLMGLFSIIIVSRMSQKLYPAKKFVKSI